MVRMEKKSKLVYGKSCICIFNTHAYCLTPENVYYTTSVNNNFYSTINFYNTINAVLCIDFNIYFVFQFLYYFAFCHEDCPDDFHVVTNFPRRTLPCEPSKNGPDPPSFEEAGLGKNEMLFVQDNEA